MDGGMTLEELYQQACETPSDINEHLPTLRRLAEQCEDVTEFGTRGGVSTTALVAGLSRDLRPRILCSIDINDCEEAYRRLLPVSVCHIEFRQGNTLEIDIEPTDLLFIDTLHTAAQVYAELVRHADKVRKYLVFHDTVTFGLIGEDGGPGLLDGILAWRGSSMEWTLVEYYANNNGLMVFERYKGDAV